MFMKRAVPVLQALVFWFTTLPLDFIGLFVVPIVIWKQPRCLWLWNNDQDGLAAQWYLDAHTNRPLWLNQYIWLALRNRTSNLRFLGWMKVEGEVEHEVVGRNHFWKYKWMRLWSYYWKDGEHFTSFGARINKPWSDDGVNFAFRIIGRT